MLPLYQYGNHYSVQCCILEFLLSHLFFIAVFVAIEVSHLHQHRSKHVKSISFMASPVDAVFLCHFVRLIDHNIEPKLFFLILELFKILVILQSLCEKGDSDQNLATVDGLVSSRDSSGNKTASEITPAVCS